LCIDIELLSSFRVHPFRGSGDLRFGNIRDSLLESIKALGGKKIRVFYFHTPDRKTPLEETAEGINKLYKEGLL
jgi:aryl-alcohol dehydrogenase-like predicted oxidoreductase